MKSRLGLKMRLWLEGPDIDDGAVAEKIREEFFDSTIFPNVQMCESKKLTLMFVDR